MILNDCVDVKKLQELQDAFSDFAGLEAVVVDAEGERLTQGHDFQGEETDAYDIVVNGERLGAVVVSHSVDKKTKGAAWMLSTVISQAAGLEELDHKNTGRFDSVKDDIKKSGELVQMINEKTGHLKGSPRNRRYYPSMQRSRLPEAVRQAWGLRLLQRACRICPISRQGSIRISRRPWRRSPT